jgi:hypothetical protein
LFRPRDRPFKFSRASLGNRTQSRGPAELARARPRETPSASVSLPWSPPVGEGLGSDGRRAHSGAVDCIPLFSLMRAPLHRRDISGLKVPYRARNPGIGPVRVRCTARCAEYCDVQAKPAAPWRRAQHWSAPWDGMRYQILLLARALLRFQVTERSIIASRTGQNHSPKWPRERCIMRGCGSRIESAPLEPGPTGAPDA